MTPLDADVERELDRVDHRLRAIENVPMQLATVQVELSGIKEDLAELKHQFDARVEERKREAADRLRAQINSRRWLVATVFSAATLVVGALAILLPALIGSH